MNDLIRAGALLTNEDEADTDDIAELEDGETAGSVGEEEDGVDAETDQWQ